LTKRLQIGGIGFLISFLGALPLGTLNVTTFQIAAVREVPSALWFALAVVLVELLVVRLTLNWKKAIDLGHRLFYYVLPMATMLLLYLAYDTLYGSGYEIDPSHKSVSVTILGTPFIFGLLLSAMNPLHIPFWVGWNNVLRAKNKLFKAKGMYLSYILGIGLGSLAGLFIFIVLGSYFLDYLGRFAGITSFIMGFVYMAFAAYLLFMFYKHHIKLTIAP